MKSPLISIIIPIYNVDEYISDCLGSVPSGCSLEVVMVDDGSTDGSGDKAEEILKSRGGIPYKLIKQPNGGASSARNTGIAAAEGRYIVFLDSDDYFLKEEFVRLVSLLSETDKDIVIGNFYRDTGGELEHDLRDFPERFNTAPKRDALDIFSENYECIIWANAYKRELFDGGNLRFIEGVVCEDVEWIPRVFYKAETFLFSGLSWYCYRIRGGSVMTSVYPKKEIDRLKVGSAVYAFAETLPVGRFRKKLYNVSNDLFRTALRNLKKYGTDDADRISAEANKHIHLLKKPLCFQNIIRYQAVNVLGVRGFASLNSFLKLKKRRRG